LIALALTVVPVLGSDDGTSEHRGLESPVASPIESPTGGEGKGTEGKGGEGKGGGSKGTKGKGGGSKGTKGKGDGSKGTKGKGKGKGN
jgi:hypothetical protein